MLTMRPIEPDGKWGGKQKKEYILDRDGNKQYDPAKRQYMCRSIPSTDWNRREKADEWCKAWEDAANAELERLGFDSRIDRRSYAEQGIERIPTVHMGVAAMQMERRGIRTERGDINREVVLTNQMLGQLRARIRKLKNWAYSQQIQDAPGIGDMMDAINRGQSTKSNWQRIADLKVKARVLMFIQQNGIHDMESLAEKITDIHQQRYDFANTVKKQERRITTLNAHIEQVEIYKQHGAVYKKYKALDPKKRGAYLDKHAGEIEQYEAASKYLKEHLNGRTVIPEKEWRKERDKLLAERYANVDEYYKLRDDVKSVETLRRGAENLMLDVPLERSRNRSHDLAL
jgi:hypothetical protein